MEVHVSSLQGEVSNMRSCASNYESSVLNLYNELGHTSSYWQDTNSGRFISNIASEKTVATTSASEMKQVVGIYSMIADSYSALGNDIKFELSERGTIEGNFNAYIDSLDAVIAAYNSLDTGFGPDELGEIESQKATIESAKSEVEGLRGQVDQIFQQIQDIETEVSSNIGSVNVSIVQASNPGDFAQEGK